MLTLVSEPTTTFRSTAKGERFSLCFEALGIGRPTSDDATRRLEGSTQDVRRDEHGVIHEITRSFVMT